MAMGAANVIPGVSGGTIALITGIFERLINSLKSFNITAVKLLFKGKFRSFAGHVQLDFLLAVFSGIFIAIFSLAKLLRFLFDNYPVFVWAFFFGLILSSVYYVGKTVSGWKITTVVMFLTGAAIAAAITLFRPAQENSGLFYLLICGVVALCSMILPGLSGSFILILMGNYELIMIDAVSDLNLKILLPVGIGAVAGLIAFSHFLSWIFKRYRDQTISLLTGFMAGSLLVLWPWKDPVFRLDEAGALVMNRSGEPLIDRYRFLLPDTINNEFWISMACVLAGILVIAFIELTGKHRQKPQNE